MRSHRLFLIFLLFANVLSGQKAWVGAEYTATKTAEGERGMVVAPHPLASAIGAEVLRQGGNAMDAAVAVQLAIAVVYPRAGNVGGGGLLVIRTQNGETDALD